MNAPTVIQATHELVKNPLKPRSPWLAVGLSMLAPGLGQLYAGRPLRALGWFGGALATTGGFLTWIMSEVHFSPAEGAGWFAGMLFCQLGSWFDAHRGARTNHRFELRVTSFKFFGYVAPEKPVTRNAKHKILHETRNRPEPKRSLRFGTRPALAGALSVLCPGLGHVYLYGRYWLTRLLLTPVFLAPATLVMLAEALEEPPVPGWPGWLMHWPAWLTMTAGAALSAAAILHAYGAAFRRRGHRPRLPRMSSTIWVLALAAWMIGLLPWETWLKSQVRSFKIPSSSMEPTLLVGDRIWAKRADILARGDLIVFHPPDRPHIDYIKRVIGLPGEQLRIKEQIVYVGGQPLVEPYTIHSDPFSRAPGRDDFGPITVPAGCYFVMGDNRDNSRDSRSFGPVPETNIFGRAYKKFWPLDRTGLLTPRVPE